MNVAERRRIEQRVRDAYESVAADTEVGVPPVTFITTRSGHVPLQAPSSPRGWSGRRSFLVGIAAVTVAAVLVMLVTVIDRHDGTTTPRADVPSVPEFYQRLASALDRPGQVYRQDESLSTEFGGVTSEAFRRTTWIDSSGSGGRLEQTAPQQPAFRYGELVDGDQGYRVVGVITNGVATGQVQAPNTGTVPACYGTTPALSLLLECSTAKPELHTQQTISSGDYEGTPAIVLKTTTSPDLTSGGSASEHEPPLRQCGHLLPIATVTTYQGPVAIGTGDGTTTQTGAPTNRSTYEPGFVHRSEVPAGFFTVASMSTWATVAPSSDGTQATPSGGYDPTACIGATPPNAPIAGCIFERDMQLNPDQRDALEATQPLAGLPVYDEATKTTIIGYLTDVGFVPNELVSRYDDLKKCNDAANRSTKPDAECRSLFLKQGVSPEVLDHDLSRPTASDSTTTVP